MEKKLPEHLVGHCQVGMNATTILVIGGGPAFEISSSKTWLVNIFTGKYEQGPEMGHKRQGHGCSRSGDTIVVTGGWDGSEFIKSTEILTKDSLKWAPGSTIICRL